MADDVAVLDALRAAILDGEYTAGQRLVELQRHRGARVRIIPLAEAIEITEVRQLLEGLTAARAAERVTTAHAGQLEQIIVEMREAVAAAELLRYSDANARLHGLVRAIAAHQTATGILERLRAQMVRHQFALSLVPGRPAVSLAQHERIVAAITARDPAAAQAAMEEHIAGVIDALRSLPAGHADRPPAPTERASTGG